MGTLVLNHNNQGLQPTGELPAVPPCDKGSDHGQKRPGI